MSKGCSLGACCINRNNLIIIIKDTPELTGRSSKYLYSAQLCENNSGATSVKRPDGSYTPSVARTWGESGRDNKPETIFNEDATSVLYPSFRVSFHQRTGFETVLL